MIKNKKDFREFMDGANMAYEDFSDAAWFEACKTGVMLWNKEYPDQAIDEHEGVLLWIELTPEHVLIQQEENSNG